MTTVILMMIGSAITNALAFTGSNYLFSSLSNPEERKRHNLALEKLTYDTDIFNQTRLKRLDYINEKLKEQGHANKTFQDVDLAMQAYYDLTGTLLDPLPPEPNLYDYLGEEDVNSIQAGELTFLALGLIGTGFLVYKFS